MARRTTTNLQGSQSCLPAFDLTTNTPSTLTQHLHHRSSSAPPRQSWPRRRSCPCTASLLTGASTWQGRLPSQPQPLAHRQQRPLLMQTRPMAAMWSLRGRQWAKALRGQEGAAGGSRGKRARERFERARGEVGWTGNPRVTSHDTACVDHQELRNFRHRLRPEFQVTVDYVWSWPVAEQETIHPNGHVKQAVGNTKRRDSYR